MSNADHTHQFSPAEVVKISAIVQRKLAASIPALITDAIGEVIGMRLDTKPTEPTKARILKTLSEAPQHAPQHPAESRFMACHAMTKTTLRRFIGNSAPGFAEALDELTQAGQIQYTKTIGAKGRLLHVYGLADTPRENPKD